MRDHAERVRRRQVLRVLVVAGPAGIAGCLGDSDEENGDAGSGDDDSGNISDTGDEETDDEPANADDSDDEDDSPYYREELTNAIENLAAPEPGNAVVVFENDEEYHTEDIECSEDPSDPDDPEKGNSEGFFEFDDGEAFSVELSRGDDFDSLQNTLTLTVPNSDEDSQFEEAAIPRSMRPIKPEEGTEGRSAFVIREDETWYGGIEFSPPDEEDLDFGETWVAITCG